MLYAVVFELQQPQIAKWCWGDCGDGLVGAVDMGRFTAVPCRREDCPHLERQMDVPMGDVNGEPIVLRKLKPIEQREGK